MEGRRKWSNSYSGSQDNQVSAYSCGFSATCAVAAVDDVAAVAVAARLLELLVKTVCLLLF